MKTLNETSLNDFLSDIKLNLLISEPFLGYVISKLNIFQDNTIDTLCIYFNNDLFKYEIKYNFKFLLTLQNFKEVLAVFKHELFHLIFKHHFRAITYEKQYGYIDMKTANISMDISINQYIDNLPDLALDYRKFNVEKGLDFESYYKVLYKDKKSDSEGKDKNGSSSSNSKGDNLTDTFSLKNNNDNLSKKKQENEEGKSKEKSEDNNQKASGSNQDKSMSSDNSSHNELIDSVKNTDIDIIEKMTQELVNDAIKQTANKYGNGGYMEELSKLWNETSKVRWSKIVKQFVEKTILANEKIDTWMKINKRFDFVKGKKKIFKAKVMIAIDTSGSISEKTIYAFLNEIKHIIKEIEIEVIYFHSEVYNHFVNLDPNKIKQIQRGGTWIQKPIEFAKNKKFKNLIVMTDGLGEQNIELLNLKIIFIKDTLNEIYIPKINKIKGNNIFKNYSTIKVSN
jgi:predicted metal-dependent peptidase